MARRKRRWHVGISAVGGTRSNQSSTFELLVDVTPLQGSTVSVTLLAMESRRTWAIDAQLDRQERGLSIVCPACGHESYHPTDIRERYCGRCHRFHDDLLLDGLDEDDL